MTDPFQNVDSAGEEFIQVFADAMDLRQADPTMERIVSDYLARFACDEGGLIIEVGAGAGAVSQRIAKQLFPARVVGYEPSAGFVAQARTRAGDIPNLSFEIADGANLPLADQSVDNVVFHTVLTHVPDPASLIAEAKRVLKPGGRLAICDVDFSKGTLASFPDDPLDACAKAFIRGFVTDAHIVAKLRPLLRDAGLTVESFDLHSRVVANTRQMLPWVSETTRVMVSRGEIGAPLAKALVDEYELRLSEGRLYGYQAVAVAVAVNP